MVIGEAAVVWGPGQPFVMEQVQVDPPQKLEVRIKILFTSVCHTDLSAWQGEVCISMPLNIFLMENFQPIFCHLILETLLVTCYRMKLNEPFLEF